MRGPSSSSSPPRRAGGPPLGIGLPWAEGGAVFNVYAILSGGRVAAFARKYHLPNYNVFDEPRVFHAGAISGPFSDRAGPGRHADLRGQLVPGRRRGDGRERRRDPDGAERLAVSPRQVRRADDAHGEPGGGDRAAARLSSTWSAGRTTRCSTAARSCSTRAAYWRCSCPVFDEVDGRSRLRTRRRRAGARGERTGRRASRAGRAGLPARWWWRSATTCARPASPRWCSGSRAGSTARWSPRSRSTRSGAENVRCVMLPSEYTSGPSLEDAAGVACALGCRLDELSIEPGRAAVMATLAPLFAGRNDGS